MKLGAQEGQGEGKQTIYCCSLGQASGLYPSPSECTDNYSWPKSKCDATKKNHIVHMIT